MNRWNRVWLLALLALLALPLAARAAVPDDMAKRTAACVACHGAEGRATNAGYFPRIAGKPEAYLYQQLRNFRDGRRRNPAMNHLVAHLSDDYLKEMAAYFAAQHPPYPAPHRSALAPAMLERGRRLVFAGDPARKLTACVACHGQALAGVQPAVPGLLGLSSAYLTMQLGAWRNGSRKAAAPDCMAHVATRLDAEEVAAIAGWLAAQPVPASIAPAGRGAIAMPLDCGGAP